MFVPIHDNFNPEEADLQAVADLGDLNVLELRSDGCASIVYMEDNSDDQLRFATYDNGLWAIEIIPHDADGSIIDIDFTFDGNDLHILFTLTMTTHSTIQPSQMVDGRLQPAHHLSLKYPALLARKQRLCLTVHLFPLINSIASASSWDSDIDVNGDIHFAFGAMTILSLRSLFRLKLFGCQFVQCHRRQRNCCGLNGSIHMLFYTMA